MLAFSEICIERPLGTNGNNIVLNLLEQVFSKLNYKAIELAVDCTVWQSNNSFIEQNNRQIKIFPSPFSREIRGKFPIKYVSTLMELQNIKDFNGILVFMNELSKNGIMPQNFLFYFPENDKLLYEILESIKPKGIVAITGQDPVSGLNPFPIFEDVNLEIPTAYVSSLEHIVENNDISIEISSKTYKEKSKQLIFRKEGSSKEIILIAAHMDSKYFTDGAIDNASGVYTLCELANLIKDKIFNHTIEIVPFNGEDSPEVSGQLAYVDYLGKNNLKIKSVINIDGVGHSGSKNMFSFFNYDENKKNNIVAENNLTEGEQWYSGDHGMFVFQEIPCIAITASNMYTDLIKITHTKSDKIELVDIK
jgi:aminopeptidase YwaD